MKNLLVIALVLFTINAMAQKQGTQRPNRNAGSEMMNQMTPNERADLRTKQLTLKLDLNDAQQNQVHALVLKQASTNNTKRMAWKTANRDGSARPTKDEVLKMRNERLDQQIEMKRNMKTILTPEQYAKYEEIQAANSNNRNNRGRAYQKNNN